VITSFNSGTTETFPLYVWSQAQRGVPPEVTVIGTMIFGAAIVLMLANTLFAWRRTPKGAT
jgi:spermidine/putrescine transport system permease protein